MPALRHFDAAYWNREITDAVTDPDPVRSNRKITRCHRRLGQALTVVTGRTAGPNFHTWAVWGSAKAGETIRGEGFGAAVRPVIAAGGVIGVCFGLVAAIWLGWIAFAVGITLGAAIGYGFAVVALRRAARLLLAGNRLVLDDIGRVTARFIETFHADRRPDPAKLARFVADLSPLLARAFTRYFEAKFAAGRAKSQAAWLGNCLAVLHEHHKLQPYIAGSIPPGLRLFATAHLMTFRIGSVHLSVAAPITGLPTGWADGVNEPAVHAYLGSADGAADWTCLADRMRYVFALFRAYHDRKEVAGQTGQSSTKMTRAGQTPVRRPMGAVSFTK